MGKHHLKGMGAAAVAWAALAVSGLCSSCDDGGGGGGRTCGMTDLEARLFDIINDLRRSGTECGGTPMAPAPALDCDEALVRAARGHSQDMADNNYFDHTGLDGSTPPDRFEAAGFTGTGAWGENIAAGPGDAESVLAMWHASSGHCSNIMNPSFTVAGVGYGSSASSTYASYWTLALGSGVP